MARVLLSGLVSDIRGKLNGSVFKRGNAGLIIQNKPASSRKKTGSIIIKGVNTSNFLLSAVQATNFVRNQWNNLTQVQRDVWDALAVAQPQPQKNNSSLFLTGLQIFLKANVIRIMNGEAAIVVPVIGNALSAPIEVIGIQVGLIMEVEFNRNRVAGEDIFVKVSASVRDTVHTVGSRTRLMRIQPAVLANTVDITQQYLQQFGQQPIVGAIVFSEVIAQNSASGLSIASITNRIETT